LQPAHDARQLPSCRYHVNCARLMWESLTATTDPMTATTLDFASEWCCGPGVITDFRCAGRLVSGVSSEKHSHRWRSFICQQISMEEQSAIQTSDLDSNCQTAFWEVVVPGVSCLTRKDDPLSQ
jgi:hypothetical protein